MLKKTGFRTLARRRTWLGGAGAALIAASIAVGTGSVMASQATTTSWSLLIAQKQAAAHAQMTKAGVGPSLAGNSSPAGS